LKKDYQVSDAEVNALKALAKGLASAGQQQLALRFLFNISGIRNAPEVFDTDLQQGFDTGKRFIGWQVARLVELTGITTDPSETKTKES
jgi:hypothetical protein